MSDNNKKTGIDKIRRRLARVADMAEHGLDIGALAWKTQDGVFPYLDKIGFPCHIRGATATFAERVNGREAVSRACVALGRDLAGLPPLVWG
jgi:hypothetical protein